MGITGGCRCGAVRYEAEGSPAHHALCWCNECRKSAGAPVVGWALFPEGAVTITGEPVTYNSSGDAMRSFCGTCGTGLFYRSASIFPDQVDIQSATFDDPDAIPAQACIQMADAPAYATRMHEMPRFERYPG